MPEFCLTKRLKGLGFETTCYCRDCVRERMTIPEYSKSLYPQEEQADVKEQSDLGRVMTWPENNTPTGIPELDVDKGDDGSVRTFAGGATRDTTVDKHDFAGFLSVLVLRRFGEYMHKHRKQSDGQLRDSDNWKKGMPRRVFAESLLRHALDVVGYITEDDNQTISQDDLEEALMALIFNAQGLAREVLKGRSVE